MLNLLIQHYFLIKNKEIDCQRSESQIQEVDFQQKRGRQQIVHIKPYQTNLNCPYIFQIKLPVYFLNQIWVKLLSQSLNSNNRKKIKQSSLQTNLSSRNQTIDKMMQIKIRPASNTDRMSPIHQRDKPLRMTLQQYLQSTNLRRRINSRSRSKSKKQANQPNQPQQKCLQLPQAFNQTMQFFKLNQEWKSRKLFTSWIVHLKQLCRQYIRRDEDYVQVARMVEKIAEFVKNQVETIKKDNLLLESYLVSEASYWVGEGQQQENGNLSNNNDRLSNYLRAVLYSRSQLATSPNRSQQLIENSTCSPQLIKERESYVITKTHTTSTQPKSVPHPSTASSQHMPRPTGSSTTLKTIDPRGLKQNRRSQNQQHVYPFKEKNNIIGVQSYHSDALSKQRKARQQQVNIRSFQSHSQKVLKQNQRQNINIKRYNNQLQETRSNSRNEEEVPQLSLMSIYDQKKTCTDKTENQFSLIKYPPPEDKFTVKSIPYSQFTTKSQLLGQQSNQLKQHDSSKPPLRDRNQKVHKTDGLSPTEFKRVVLHGDTDKESPENRVKRNSRDNLQHQSITRFQLHNTDSPKQRHSTNSTLKLSQINPRHKPRPKEQSIAFQTSPLTTRQTPNPFSIYTPSTIRDESPSPQEFTLPQKEQESKITRIKEKHSTEQNTAYGSSIVSFDTVERRSSRENIRENIRRKYAEYKRV